MIGNSFPLQTKSLKEQILSNVSTIHADLVDIKQREKLENFLRSDQVLLRHVPVCPGHLVLHLIHPSRRCSDTNTAGRMEAHRLQREREDTGDVTTETPEVMRNERGASPVRFQPPGTRIT